MEIVLADRFWAPRLAQLRERTLPAILANLERQGAVDNFRRLVGQHDGPRQALHFSDSDLYKWVEAACLGGRADLAEPIVDLIVAAAHPDGYVHTYYDVGAGSPGRYTDLAFGHEHYCTGHLIEAAIAHQAATGDLRLLDTARRAADEIVATFGPGRDERTDGHPEIELALARLAAVTGDERYLHQARWTVEQQLAAAGSSVATVELSGHAVKALYLASAIAEVALAIGDEAWTDAATRLFASMVEHHAYPTGAVGGRWLDESVGKPYELPDAMAYAESCAAVAAVQFCERIWRLTGDPRTLDQIELLLFNAVPCGVGAEGDTWFYSQPHAVAEVAAESNPWVEGFEYGPSMLLSWFPARRHRWYPVACCPPNLARLFATVPARVAHVDPAGDLRLDLPVACRIRGAGWDVEVGGDYPSAGAPPVTVLAAPSGRRVLARVPGWAGGAGHAPLPADGHVPVAIDWAWWETDERVEGAAGTAYLRWGPVVHCVEGVDVPDVDLRQLVVDPQRPPREAFALRAAPPEGALHRPIGPPDPAPARPLEVATVPYAEWANRGTTTMRMRFPIERRP